MQNHPFTSNQLNITDEKFLNTIPTILYGQNVLVSQEQHRKIFDNLTTTIAGNPYCASPTMQGFSSSMSSNPVTFTFGKPQLNCHCQQPNNYTWQCQTNTPMHMQPGLNQMHQKNALDLLQLQQQLGNNPYQLRLHLDNQTSTTDLKESSKCRADFKNLATLLMSKWPYWLQTSSPLTNHKKLTLKNVKTAKAEGSIVDELLNNKKQVKFADDEVQNSQSKNLQDAEAQVNLCCPDNPCNYEDNNKNSRKEKKSKRTKKEEDSSDVSSDNEDNR